VGRLAVELEQIGRGSVGFEESILIEGKVDTGEDASLPERSRLERQSSNFPFDGEPTTLLREQLGGHDHLPQPYLLSNKIMFHPYADGPSSLGL
jgi:hypothetical protein